MKLIKKTILLVILFLMIPMKSKGEVVEDLLSEQMDIINFDQVEQVVDHSFLKEYYNVESFKGLVGAVLKGEIDFSIRSLFSSFLKYFGKEIRGLALLMAQVLALCLLSQILKNLDLSFEKSSIGEVGFYVVYITLILIIFKSFSIIMDISLDAIREVDTFMEPIIPLLIILIISGGNITVGAKAPLVIASLDFLVDVITSYIVPVIYFIAILELINHISKQDVLSQLLKSSKNVINKGLKYIFVIYAVLMGAANIVPSMIDGVINKGAKTAMGSIPVVGSSLSGVMDTVLACSGVIKEGVGIGAVLFLVIISLIPIIKLIAACFMYKLMAALVQPIADKRMVNLLSGMGDYVGLLLGVLMTVLVLFVASIAIMVQATNMTMMMR